ncbi:sulfite oxidase-like oxidoreductase [Oscillatoria sp. CS-180]|uniref:sulfite oxidase-like oxidoreductase n=1 Tax=Oscillatoria sp. CS-180 TaxID=3021720 RepID=UPI0023300E22|nr:sulfite oxidase-like oxidoreductase [Oscillatoria sp. CS-180]MDB9525174.1 sulfite oxidase-like oxidoreductase [Oscillatoria sp. CS-180]
MKYFEKPGADVADRVPPGQHLAKGFPVLTYGDTPQVSQADWKLKTWGHAERKTYTWEDMMALPQQDFTADFHCVTTWSKLDVKWTGIAVPDFLQTLAVEKTASHVLLHCFGDYTTNLTLEDFNRPENFFAHTLYGEPLPVDHGGPMRLVVPHLYAWKSAKWLNGIEFLPQENLGFWERNGYHRRGEPFAEERYSGR